MLFQQRKCAKLGSAIASAQLWDKIANFPSGSICKPTIRIILVSSGHCVLHSELPWTQTIAPQWKVNTKLMPRYILPPVPGIRLRVGGRTTFGGIVGRWLWTCAPRLPLGNSVVRPQQKVWMQYSFENKNALVTHHALRDDYFSNRGRRSEGITSHPNARYLICSVSSPGIAFLFF